MTILNPLEDSSFLLERFTSLPSLVTPGHQVLLQTVGRGTRLAYPYLLQGVRLGLGADKILGALKASGFGVRRTDGLRVIRALREQKRNQTYVDSLGFNELPDEGRLSPSLTTLLRNYSYRIVVNGIHRDTGENTSLFYHISTSTLLTKREALDKLALVMSQDPELYPLEDITGNVQDILYNALPEGLM